MSVEVVALGAILFAVTDIDDLFLLVAFYADPKFRHRDIAIGQYLGIAALVAVSLAAALVSLAVPRAYVGLLGLAPIVIGIVHLLRKDREEDTPPRRGGTGALAIAAITVANGGDNLAIYTAVFATRRAAEIAVILAIFMVGVAVWLALARALATHRHLRAPLQHWAPILTPWVLIALGLWVLYDAGTLALLGGA